MENQLSRRSFLTAGALAGAAIGAMGLAGCAPAAKSSGNDAIPATGDDIQWDEECDVLIVGGGGSGSACAYGAAKEGASVIVLESQPNVAFTSTALCGGFISFVGTPEQEKMGIKDSPDVFVEDVTTYGGGHANPDVARLFAENCSAYIDLLNEIGVEWLNKDEPMQGKEQSVPRIVQVSPGDHQNKLTAAAQEAGADYRFDTFAERLVTDSDGKVIGVIDESGTSYKGNKGVVLATGGITGNDEMLNNCMSGLSSKSVLVKSSPGHTGQGHKMLAQLGCTYTGGNTVNCCPGLHPEASDMTLEFEGYDFGTIDVNSQGRRFLNEADYYSYANTYALVKDHTGDEPAVFYQIFDQKVVDAANSGSVAYGGISDAIMGALTKADTLEELSELIGAPYLASTVATYNEDITTNGKDTYYGREATSNTSGTPLSTIDTAPFYAWPQNAWLPYTPTCGVPVDVDLHPLNQFNEPIEGVYCIGELMHRTVCGDRYPDGTATAANGSLGLHLGKKLAGTSAE